HTIGGHLKPSASAAASMIVTFSHTNTVVGWTYHRPANARRVSHVGSPGAAAHNSTAGAVPRSGKSIVRTRTDTPSHSTPADCQADRHAAPARRGASSPWLIAIILATARPNNRSASSACAFWQVVAARCASRAPAAGSFVHTRARGTAAAVELLDQPSYRQAMVSQVPSEVLQPWRTSGDLPVGAKNQRNFASLGFRQLERLQRPRLGSLATPRPDPHGLEQFGWAGFCRPGAEARRHAHGSSC